MNYKAEWEPIYDAKYGDMMRMRVPGGWLVRLETWQIDEDYEIGERTTSMCFVPDDDSAWVLAGGLGGG